MWNLSLDYISKLFYKYKNILPLIQNLGGMKQTG